jgi:hypothetical protein
VAPPDAERRAEGSLQYLRAASSENFQSIQQLVVHALLLYSRITVTAAQHSKHCALLCWPECYVGPANRLQTAIFGDSSGICKTRIQQQQTTAAEFETFLLKTAMGL